MVRLFYVFPLSTFNPIYILTPNSLNISALVYSIDAKTKLEKIKY